VVLGIIIVGVVGLFVLWRYFFFFRNPSRVIPIDSRSVLSPADGRVLYIKKVKNDGKEPIMAIKNRRVIALSELMHVDDEPLAGAEGYLVGIMMGPLNVHYNRSPIAGHIRKIAHKFPSQSNSINACMFNAISNLFLGEKPYYHDCDHVIDNERASYIVTGESFSLYVTQIAERWVKRIVSYCEEQTVQQGEVFGLIRMGSQVDLFVPRPDQFQVSVREGQRVKAGLTELLRWTGPGSP
jgi:phosphatidylserine decarboxylase